MEPSTVIVVSVVDVTPVVIPAVVTEAARFPAAAVVIAVPVEIVR
jgi:hypothetical protein